MFISPGMVGSKGGRVGCCVVVSKKLDVVVVVVARSVVNTAAVPGGTPVLMFVSKFIELAE